MLQPLPASDPSQPYRPLVRLAIRAMAEFATSARSRLERQRRGYLVSMAWMRHPEVRGSGAAMTQQLKRLLRRAAAGFPFAAPERGYVEGRLALVGFG